MNILMLGDIVGRAGRQAVLDNLDALRQEHALDVVIVNGENAAAGRGITGAISRDLLDAGVHCITSGDHIFDQKETYSYIAQEPRLLRPLNFPPTCAGQGSYVIETGRGQRVLVVNLIGRVFVMGSADCPFRAMDEVLQKYILGGNVNAIVVDFHAEATSEKQAMAHYLDGRVTAVVGTHTHIPTADTRVLSGGTAVQTDLGMCGNYDSVIGVNKDEAIERMLSRFNRKPFTRAGGNATLCGVVISVNEKGLTERIVRLGL